MKALHFACILLVSTSLTSLAVAAEATVFEVSQKTVEVSLEALQDGVNTDGESTALSLYSPAKRIKAFELGDKDLGTVFDEAVNGFKGDEAFFKAARAFLIKDGSSGRFFLVHLEDGAAHFRIAPMETLAGDWLVPSRFAYPSTNAVVISGIK